MAYGEWWLESRPLTPNGALYRGGRPVNPPAIRSFNDSRNCVGSNPAGRAPNLGAERAFRTRYGGLAVGATLGASDGARGRVRCMPLLGVLVAHNCALPALALKTRTFDAGKNLER
jgi:hypothetical protein